MKHGILIFLLATFIRVDAQTKWVQFDHDTIQLGDITREMANHYIVKFPFKNNSNSTLFFLNDATAWNDVSDFSHYAYKQDTVAAGKWGCYTVRLQLGSKRWIHYSGRVIFRTAQNDDDTAHLYLLATVHDSLLPIHQEPLIQLSYPHDEKDYVIHLGDYNFCAKHPKAILQFQNISRHLLTYYEHAIIWNNEEIQFETKDWQHPMQLQPGDTARVDVEFRQPKIGPFDLRSTQNNHVLPYTITAIDDKGVLVRKDFYLRFTGNFYCEHPPFLVYITRNKEQYKKESSYGKNLSDTLSDCRFITIWISDNKPHRFQLKRNKISEQCVSIPFITFNWNYPCVPPNTDTDLVKNFDYYLQKYEFEMEPNQSISVGYLVKNKKDLNAIDWNSLDFYIDGNRVWLKEFIREYLDETP